MKRSWRRFSLRALLALTALCALGVWVWTSIVEPRRKEQHRRQLVAQLKERGIDTWGDCILVRNRMVTPDDAALLSQAIPRPREIYCYDFRCGDEELRILCRFTQLQVLRWQGPVTDAGMRHLAELKDLRTLSLYSNAWKGGGIDQLGQLHELNLVWLAGSPRGDARLGRGVENWTGLDELTHLHLHRFSVSGEGMRTIGSLPKLQDLHLIDCRDVDEGMRHLGPSPQLKRLDLFYCRDLTDAGVSSLGRLENLETLSLVCDGESQHGFTNDGLTHLAGLSKLRSLCLYSPEMNDEAFFALRQAPSLDVLGLGLELVHHNGNAGRDNIRTWLDRICPASIGSIQSSLRSKTGSRFTNDSLEEVVEELSRRHYLNIQIDVPELERAGRLPRIPITVDFRESETSLRQALDEILSPLRLDWIIDNNGLRITTKEAAEKNGLRALLKTNPDLVIYCDGSWRLPTWGF